MTTCTTAARSIRHHSRCSASQLLSNAGATGASSALQLQRRLLRFIQNPLKLNSALMNYNTTIS
jgi:hypothetical protein